MDNDFDFELMGIIEGNLEMLKHRYQENYRMDVVINLIWAMLDEIYLILNMEDEREGD